MNEKTIIGQRLRDERERLSLGQVELAEAGGVNRNTQGAYERGERMPDAAYLAAAAALGVDVLFVITGARTKSVGLTPEQAGLLEALGSLAPEALHAVEVIVRALGERQWAAPEPLSNAFDARPTVDLALWRAVALSIPGSPGVEKGALLTPQQWIDIVNGGYEYAKREEATRVAAEHGAQIALTKARQK